jgi:uncharacterized repeat protein (TIGR02543 family)
MASTHPGTGYTVTFASQQKYIGFWWSAGNPGNTVRFKSNGQTVASMDVGTTGNVNTLIGKLGTAPTCTNSSTYLSKTNAVTAVNGSQYLARYYFGSPYGYTSTTPTTCSTSALPTEAYLYLHAYAQNGASFDSMEFSGAGFELDNITISTEALTPPESLVLIETQAAAAVTFNITYNENSGSGATGGATTYISGSSFTLRGASTRTHYTFNGWYTAISGGTRAGGGGDTYDPGTTANITLYAQWTRTTYAVTYNSQGGNAIASGVFESGGSTTSTPANAVRSGYVFNGWFAAASGGSSITFPYAPGVTQAITLHAQWTAITYSITYFDSNSASASGADGGTAPSAQTGSAATSVALSANTLSLSNYAFSGWATSNGSTSVAFTNSDTVTITVSAVGSSSPCANNFRVTATVTPPVQSMGLMQLAA